MPRSRQRGKFHERWSVAEATCRASSGSAFNSSYRRIEQDSRYADKCLPRGGDHQLRFRWQAACACRCPQLRGYPESRGGFADPWRWDVSRYLARRDAASSLRSEEHTSELQSLMRISYAVFCLKKKNTEHTNE